MSVAIIGWILNMATSVPLTAPKIIATTMLARNATSTVPPLAATLAPAIIFT